MVSVVVPAPPGMVMVTPPEVLRNVEGGTKRRPRCRRMSQYNATKDSIKVGVPYEPRPDDSYSYQPSPEPSQYPAFDNTH